MLISLVALKSSHESSMDGAGVQAASSSASIIIELKRIGINFMSPPFIFQVTVVL
jgi:hypothetical protein